MGGGRKWPLTPPVRKFPDELKVTNSALGLGAGHPLLEEAVRRVPATFRPNCWDCLGPSLLTGILKDWYNTTVFAGMPRDAAVQVLP